MPLVAYVRRRCFLVGGRRSLLSDSFRIFRISKTIFRIPSQVAMIAESFITVSINYVHLLSLP
ncbi:putative phage protein [Bacillus licheniformis DSM 13 = ATCC 14580]|nr:putative phage protein [Bacillus licheniformis DSM 13 = ATCC 14580]